MLSRPYKLAKNFQNVAKMAKFAKSGHTESYHQNFKDNQLIATVQPFSMKPTLGQKSFLFWGLFLHLFVAQAWILRASWRCTSSRRSSIRPFANIPKLHRISSQMNTSRVRIVWQVSRIQLATGWNPFLFMGQTKPLFVYFVIFTMQIKNMSKNLSLN